MSYIEGVGDEVVGVFVTFLIGTVVALLWKTTHVRDTHIHSVIITATPLGNAPTTNTSSAQTTPGGTNSASAAAATAPSTTAAAGSDEVDNEADDAAEEGDDGGQQPPTIRIKLRFLDDTTLEVETRLTERLSRFRRRHLDSHLNLNPGDKIKLIFNGKIIHREAQQLSEAGIYDNCTVHCLVQREDTSMSRFTKCNQL